ncbi:MAG: hypothetical protein KC944_16675, partial [Candidatus Omnitrophica bacterium]|nr:hypothetical protein [Candidatus Omnitrophota bacterium]
FPVYNMLYKFSSRAFISPVCRMKLKEKMYSVNENEVLFLYADIRAISGISRKSVTKLNLEMNKLAERLIEKHIVLIVLPSPDKYDLYYEYIIDNNYPKNQLFDYLREQDSKYVFIDTKEMLLAEIKSGERDVYYADDSHWSPKASRVIAEKIIDLTHKR